MTKYHNLVPEMARVGIQIWQVTYGALQLFKLAGITQGCYQEEGLPFIFEGRCIDMVEAM